MENHQPHSFSQSPMGRGEATLQGDSTVIQLEAGLAERAGARADALVLTHGGQVIRDSELRTVQDKDEVVGLCRVQPRPPDTGVSTDEDCGGVSSPLTPPTPRTPHPDTPTSPLFLVEGLDSLGLSDSAPGLFSSLQSQMERQLLASPEMMRRVLGSGFVQSALSSAGPELTRALVLSNPQIQQLLQTNPELAEEIAHSDVISKVLELVRNPDLIKEVLKSEDPEVTRSQAKHHHRRFTFPHKNVKTKQRKGQGGLSKLSATSDSELSPQNSGFAFSLSQHIPIAPNGVKLDRYTSTRLSSGMQTLLEQVSSSPALMESLLSGPYMSGLLQCLSHNPELASQMLLSHPLLSENPQLQQQLRQQLPLLLQQMQSPELLSAMLNPKAVEALLQIQQGLQTLATEAPALMPAAAFGTAEHPSEPGSGPAVATATEQQQFVQQMLQALATSSDHKDLDGLSSAFEER